MKEKTFTIQNFKGDFASGLVVFLVALPLCLAIAVASGATPFAGIIAGIVGGLVVGFLSNSQLSVTGPAAGLTAIVLSAITDLGAYDVFLVAVVIAGIIQLIMGFAKAGSLSNYFPTSVIEGMLTAIGIIIILKQIPHALGFDSDPEGDLDFIEPTGHTMIDTLIESINNIHAGAVIISLVCLAILIIWDKIAFLKKLKLVPAALVAVVVGILLNQIFIATGSGLPYPEEFPYRCIKMHSYIGGLVVDPFNGSGTTTAVAKRLGRKYIGFDITEEYCKLAEERLNT